MGIQLNGITGDITTPGDVGIGGTLTYEDVANVDSIGIVTARSGVHVGPTAGVGATIYTDGGARFSGVVTATTFKGNLEGTAGTFSGNATCNDLNLAGDIIHTGDTNTRIKFAANDTVTVETDDEERLRIASNGDVEIRKNNDAKTVLKGDSVGIGTTTTTGRNAGVSTTTGTLIFNSTSGELQVYNGRGWDTCSNIFSATGGNTTYTQGNYKVHVFTSNGDFVAQGSGSVDALVVAGGGGGGATSRPAHNGAWAGGGGAGGVLYTPGHPLTPATYPVVIGAGGGIGSNGSNSTALGLTAIGGGRGGGSPYPSPGNGGAAGGSGGGGLGDNAPSSSRAAGAGTAGQGNAGGVGIDPGGGPDNYEQGGGGGGAGEAGNTDANGYGGDGRDMSTEFGTTYGESGVFGGGGAGGAGTSGSSYNEGGLGGGGDSGAGHTGNQASQAGATNTGGGGGAGGNQPGAGGQPGGSGIVLIRYLVN